MKKMKHLLIALIMLSVATTTAAQDLAAMRNETYQSNYASVTFRNLSDYTLTLKIMKIYGGLYQTVVLGPKSSSVVTFGSTASYKLKIKATRYGRSSYHKGDGFSVTCNEREWSEGEMTFQMSTYGDGLGPSISAKEFESNN